jgi:general secretion pathway protein C
MGILDNARNSLGGLKLSAINPFLKKYTPLAMAVFIGYIAADLTLLLLRPRMLPTEAPPVRANQNQARRPKDFSNYSMIVGRNVFNADGTIPPALSDDGSGDGGEQEAVPSQLPLALQGTIVHFNPARSIATIKLNSKNLTQSFVVDEEIEGMARVTKVERRRVTFQNLNNRRLEYIEIPDSAGFAFDLKNKGVAGPSGPVEEKGANHFVIKRSEVDRLTSNLSEVLQQAAMAPRFGADNMIDGFCFVSIQQNTIYEKLGFRVGDCITSVNGSPISSPQQAMEFYQQLRGSNNIKIGRDRDGRNEDVNYDIN